MCILVKFVPFFFADAIKIDSLWDFTSLVKLYMNNNLIEKIEGLQFLTNLKWLGKGYITIILSFLIAITAITILMSV